MKRNVIFLGGMLFLYSAAFSQVGINSETPQATLDVAAVKTDGSTAEGIIAPRLTRSQIIAADSKYGTAQTGAMVYATDVSGTATTKTANITAAGYYYFDGSVWQVMKTEPWYLENTTTQATANTQNIYQNGKIGIGNFAGTAVTSALDILDNDSEDGSNSRLTIRTFSNTEDFNSNIYPHPAIYLSNTRGTLASPAPLHNGDELGAIYFQAGNINTPYPARISSTYKGNGTSNVSDMSFWIGDAGRGLYIRENGFVGIGNLPTQVRPQVTLDVGSIAANGVLTAAEGFRAPTLRRSQLIAADELYDTTLGGTIVYVTTLDGIITTKTANITAAGYYYFDGSVWQAFKAPAAAATEPWYLQNSTTQATANTQNIYQNGNIGIGNYSASSVGSKLEVDGAATNKTAYNASTGTTIDFSKSNLAYSTSTATAPAFALNNIKDGGTYTLAWQGSSAGRPTFTAPSGITAVIAGGAATTAKLSTGDIVYTIVVIGAKAYIYTTQF